MEKRKLSNDSLSKETCGFDEVASDRSLLQWIFEGLTVTAQFCKRRFDEVLVTGFLVGIAS